MVQHLVLMTLAALLILLGEPTITVVPAFPRSYALRVAKPLLHFAPAHRRYCNFVHPVFSWLVGTVCVIWWDVPRPSHWVCGQNDGINSSRQLFSRPSFFSGGLRYSRG
jgi:hypothetical protein